MLTDDLTLLREFAATRSETAFAQLVARHLPLVHSAALRRTGDATLAEEVAQAVFLILARKAGELGPKTVLTGWLYRTTQYATADALKQQHRRQQREHQAYMETTFNPPETEAAWQQIAPVLETAMDSLGERDRQAVLLRYFENKTLGEVGAALEMSEDGARLRVNRALDKLRAKLGKAGVTLGAALIASAVATNSVQAAPAALAAKVSVLTAKGVVSTTSITALVKGTMSIMAWAKAKTAMAFSTGVLLVAGTATFILAADEKWFELDQAVLNNAPDNIMVIRPTHFGGSAKGSGMVGGNERIVGQNLPLEWGIVFADKFSSYRLSLPEGFPKDRFDYLFTLPQNMNDSSQDEVRNLMRDAIKKQFGYMAHRETRERDVLLLQVKNTNAAGLHTTVTTDINDTAIQTAVETLNSKSIPMYGVTQELEGYLGTPVLDQTGLTNRYAIDLRWDKLPGEKMEDTVKRVVLEDLGLELVPSRKPIEMLVVEKVK